MPNVSAAARAAGISRNRAMEVKDNDPDFAQEWRNALTVSRELLDRVMWEGATVGFTEEETRVTVERDGDGNIIREDRVTVTRPGKRNVALMQFLARAHNPELYREKFDVRHLGENGGPILHEVVSAAPRDLDSVIGLLAIAAEEDAELATILREKLAPILLVGPVLELEATEVPDG